MKNTHDIWLLPENRTIRARTGVTLMSALAEEGIFLRADCGGNGRCAKCAVRVFDNVASVDGETVSKGAVKLACAERLEKDLVVEIPVAAYLSPDVIQKPEISKTLEKRVADLPELANPFSGHCLAVDLGTTTIAMYLCHVEERKILGSASLKNPQALFGDDVMSRIASVSESPLVSGRLHQMAVKTVDWGIERLCRGLKNVDPENIEHMTVVGNPTMLHFFLGEDPSSIGVHPFEPNFLESREVSAGRLGFNFNPKAQVVTFPLISGFLGADIVAAALASDLENAPVGTVLADVGTNGELMVKGEDFVAAASCATGPALEGATIAHGMQAVPGAVERLKIDPKTGRCQVVVKGGGKPAGICGSGVVSAAAELLRAKIVLPDGRFDREAGFEHVRPDRRGVSEWTMVSEKESASGKAIVVTQADIRNVQLAKGAFRAGIDLICETVGVDRPRLLMVAGAFGNYIDKRDALEIGMFPVMPESDIEIVGNAAGEGAVLALFDPRILPAAETLARKTRVINLAANPRFQDAFIEELSFPDRSV